MSNNRFTKLPSRRRAPGGGYLCRLCLKPVPGRRRSWCSDECSHQYYLRSSVSYLRSHLLQRDNGICAVCGFNAREVEAQISRLRCPPYGCDIATRLMVIGAKDALAAYLKASGFSNPFSRSLWDADHIKPVVEGGGECGLENYRTLCQPCHKKATAALAARLAARKRVAA